MTTFTTGSATAFVQPEYGVAPELDTLTFGVPNSQGYTAAEDPAAGGSISSTSRSVSRHVRQQLAAAQEEDITPGLDFFEDFHVVPRLFDFGNLLSAQSSAIEVFNGHRRLPAQEWTAVVNNAGSGVSLGSQPSLPTDVGPLFSVQMTLDVAIAGDPFVIGNLTFSFEGGRTIVVPITIQRIVLFGVRPEIPYPQRFGFLTDVKTSKDGSEKRMRNRAFPRQSWTYRYLLEEGIEAQRIEHSLVDYQARTWGVPVWDEDCQLTASAAAASLTITVNATAYRDFRELGFAVILTSPTTFDVLQIASGGITATTLTFTSPTVNAYSEGAEVFPLAVSRMSPTVSGTRFPVNLRGRSVLFTCTENNVDLADLSAFSSFNGRLFLDNGNSALSGSVGIANRQRLVLIDGETGEPHLDQLEDRSKPALNLTVRAFGRQAKWELRQMVYAIGGRHISFYVPTDAEDLTLNAPITNATDTIDIDATGYAQFIRNRKPYNGLRLVLADGTTVERQITASVSVSTAVDRLTVDTNWGTSYALADVTRIDFILRVRFESDDIVLQHVDGDRAYLTASVLGVFD